MMHKNDMRSRDDSDFWVFQVATWIREFYSMMSSRAGKAPAVRSYRRRKSVLDLDLNLPAGESREQEGAGESQEQEGAGENREQGGAGENREQEGPSIQLEPQEVQANQQQPVAQPTMIDVEAIDDDVVESSPRAFAEVNIPFVYLLLFFRLLLLTSYEILLLEIITFFCFCFTLGQK